MRWLALLLVAGCGSSQYGPGCPEGYPVEWAAERAAAAMVLCREAPTLDDCPAWDQLEAEYDRRRREWIECQ